MPWTLTVTNQRQLDVDLTAGMRAQEWAELTEAMLHELTVMDRVMFLLPWGFEDQGHVQPLDDLIRVLTARGVNVERRHLG
jgi:hypothetical protein